MCRPRCATRCCAGGAGGSSRTSTGNSSSRCEATPVVWSPRARRGSAGDYSACEVRLLHAGRTAVGRTRHRRPSVTTVAPKPIVTRPWPVRPQVKGSAFARILRTTDAKQIGIMYMITSFVFFMLGGLMALLMRAELARPGHAVPVAGAVQPAVHHCPARRENALRQRMVDAARAPGRVRAPRGRSVARVVPAAARSPGARPASSRLSSRVSLGSRRRGSAAAMPGTRRCGLALGSSQLRPGHRGRRFLQPRDADRLRGEPADVRAVVLSPPVLGDGRRGTGPVSGG